ncbi:hypothetical protein [Mangrovicoccus algicola]|uniref:Uncharacterized protein n=1 Tax=Mangrovicoccus algicola TaxID=2771008 RepID=A0A8J7CH16_9RHOB|nr:hypothetical protein [Mangrovicoccus algicola]MBE3637755.1 hypothetical protein [Mangrovicoccus algicola]
MGSSLIADHVDQNTSLTEISSFEEFRAYVVANRAEIERKLVLTLMSILIREAWYYYKEKRGI